MTFIVQVEICGQDQLKTESVGVQCKKHFILTVGVLVGPQKRALKDDEEVFGRFVGERETFCFCRE